MTKRSARGAQAAWLSAVGFTAAMWLFVGLVSDIHFATNDDQFILRTFTGYAPGGAPAFHLYIHGMYAYPLQWLNRAFPGVAWFSVLELLLLSLALIVLVKSLLQCFGRAGHAPWVGRVVSVSFLTLFGMSCMARVTYTVTAAMLGAAAVAQILSVDCERARDGRLFASMTLAALLVTLGYGLRQMTALPTLAYCGVALAMHFFRSFGWGKRARRNARPLLLTIAAVALVMGGLAGLREMEITQKGERDYLAWQQARISVLDYLNLDALPKEALDEVGWTEVDNELLLQWNTMDEAISTEAFRHLRAAYDNEDTRTSPGAAIQDLLTRSPTVVRSFWILLAVALFTLAALWLRRPTCFWAFAALGCAGCLCLLFLVYLALQGRLPYRGVLVPALPFAAFAFCLLPQALPAKTGAGGARAAAARVVCALLAACALLYAVPAVDGFRRMPSQWDYDAFEDLDEQALKRPDQLLLFSTELVNDMRMFPDTSAGVPTNLMFWGGWQRGSPEYLARLSAFGIDGNHFTAKDWLHPALRFVSLAPEPNQTLLRYLRENLGAGVNYEREQISAGLYLYRFFVAAPAA